MSLFKKKTNDSKDSKPLLQLIKEDICKVLWFTLYVGIIGIIAYFLHTFLTIGFAYLYPSLGALIGIDFTTATTVDVAFWLLVSISVGAIVVFFLIKVLNIMFTKITKAILGKHVFNTIEKSETT